MSNHPSDEKEISGAGQQTPVSREKAGTKNINIGGLLASYLADRRKEIVGEWIAAVHRDREIVSSEALTHSQLTDHIPQLLDDLGDTLCHVLSEDIKEQAAWTSATHGHLRWKDGYDISELLREMRDLRLAIMPHLSGFQVDYANVIPEKILIGMMTVHGFLDDSIRTSVEQFIAADEHGPSAALHTKNGSLFHK